MPRRYKPKSECTAEEWNAYLSYQRAYTASNPQARADASRRWRERNPEKYAELQRARNARRRKHPSGGTPQ